MSSILSGDVLFSYPACMLVDAARASALHAVQISSWYYLRL